MTEQPSASFPIGINTTDRNKGLSEIVITQKMLDIGQLVLERSGVVPTGEYADQLAFGNAMIKALMQAGYSVRIAEEIEIFRENLFDNLGVFS